MVHILTSSGTVVRVLTRPQSVRTGDPAVVASLSLIMKPKLSDGVFKEQQSYLTTAAFAAFAALNKIDQRNRYRASVTLTDEPSSGLNFIQGSTSSGLGYALALFESFWFGSLGKGTAFAVPIFATGEINNQGRITPVGFVDEKLKGLVQYCHSKGFESFKVCLPVDNYKQLSEAQIQLVKDTGGQFICTDRLPATLLQLLGEGYDGDPLGRWEPFKSLLSFEYEDSLRFFGRNKDITKLSDDLDNNQGLLIVSGPSGSGKSSLIKAGLIPRLAQQNENFYWKILTPSNLEESLLTSIVRTLLERVSPNEVNELLSVILSELKSGELEKLRKLSVDLTELGIKFLFHIDQFEEFFTQTFLDEYLVDLQYAQELVKALPQLKIVLSLRSDYLNNLLNLNKISSPKISDFSERLSIDAWREIVIEQAEFSGVTFEKTPNDLAARIINDAFAVDNALPMVEFVLSRLYECADQRNTNRTMLTYEDYEKLGGITGAIAQKAEAVIEETKVTEQDLHTLFCLAVGATSEGILYAREFNIETLDTENSCIKSLVEKFRGKNIFVCCEYGDVTKIKIAHESLFQHWSRLKMWIEEQKTFLEWINSVERNYQHWRTANEKNDKLLTDDASISEGLDYLKTGILTDKYLEYYLLKSNKHKKLKLFRSTIITLIIPLFIVLSFWWYENRSIIEYHTAITEIYSVPEGIREIDIDQLENPDSFYKLEYKGDELKSISHINGNGYLIPFSDNNNVVKKSYSYNSDGILDKEFSYDRRGIMVNEKRFIFRDDMTQSVEESISNMGILNVSFFNASFLLQEGPKLSSNVAKVLKQYNQEGFTVSKQALNHYSKPTLFSASHHQVNYRTNTSGLVVTESFSDLNNNRVSNDNGIYAFNYFYDENSYLVKKITQYNNSSIVSKYTYDRQGNLIETQILNADEQISYGALEKRKMTESSYVQELSYPFPLKDFPSVDFVKVLKSVDIYGRLTEISFLDQNNKLIPQNAKNNYLPEEISAITEFISLPIYKLLISYSDNNFIQEVAVELQGGKTISIFIEYDLNDGKISSLRSNDYFLNMSLKSSLTKQVQHIPIKELQFTRSRNSLHNEVSMKTTFISDNDFECVREQVQNFVGELTSENIKCNENPVLNVNNYHRVDVVYDDISRPVSGKFFGIDGTPIITEGQGFGFHEVRISYDSYGRINKYSFWNTNGEAMNHAIDGIHQHVVQYSDNYLMNKQKFTSLNGEHLYFTFIDGQIQYRPFQEPSIINDDIVLNSIPSGAVVLDSYGSLIGVTPIRKSELKGFDLSKAKLTKLGYASQILDMSYRNEVLNISLELEKYPINSKDTDDLTNLKFTKIYDEIFSTDSLHEQIKIAQNLLPLVEVGHVSSTKLLSQLYLKIFDSDPSALNRINAIKFLKLAASKGVTDAQRLLAAEVIDPSRGFDIWLTKEEAWLMIAQASEEGNIQATFNMAYAYLDGIFDFPFKNKTIAMNYFLRACLAADADGCKSYSNYTDDASERLKYGVIGHKLDGGSENLFLSNVYSDCINSKLKYGVTCNPKLAKFYAEKAWEVGPSIESALLMADVESELGNFGSARLWISKARTFDQVGFDESSYYKFNDGQTLMPDTSIKLKEFYGYVFDLIKYGDIPHSVITPSDRKFAIEQYSRLLRQSLH